MDIFQYHPDVEPWRGGKRRDQTQTSTVGPAHQEGSSHDPMEQATAGEVVEGPVREIAEVPTVRVRLVQSLRLLPHQGASVTVQLNLDGNYYVATVKFVHHFLHYCTFPTILL